MKNLSLALNIILLLAVAYLYVDRFSGPEKAATNPTTEEKSNTSSSKIVYLNIDTLHSKSKSYQATKDELEKAYEQMSANLLSKEKAFQKDVNAYKQKASSGTLTPNQAKEIEDRLSRKQQEILQLQESSSMEMQNKTNEFDLKFNNAVKSYADSIRLVKGYDFVLLYGGVMSPMLSADGSHDITNAIVDLLNANEQ